jgi:hypothetical protein
MHQKVNIKYLQIKRRENFNNMRMKLAHKFQNKAIKNIYKK